ncbi:helix-turn-helix domain-containing protein [Pseudomonas sp. 2835]|uniref:AraC family transcriptional regulator n=1 Tax=Pseudomonas sp. 2835 TaxID=3156451 RepID=UPI003D1F6322
MWDGRVTFSDYWFGYVGHSEDSSAHSHVAIQLCIGIRGPVRVDFEQHSLEGAGVIIGPFVKHRSVQQPQPLAFLFIYPESPLGRALNAQLPLNGSALASQAIVDCFALQRSTEQTVAALNRIVGSPAEFDPRLACALSLLREDCDGSGAVGRAAEAVGLSSPRLRHVATRDMGVPLSQWIIWRKLERAAHALAAGHSLSEAALDGGFADQAHLSRMMRRMLGLSPAQAAGVLMRTSDSFNT